MPAQEPARASILTVRPYLPDDEDTAIALWQRTWQHAYPHIDFAARLASRLTLLGTLDGSPVGFIALEGPEHIDMLYVHPAAAGQGAGAMLCDALEKLAAARGSKQLSVDASDTARGFFERRGFVANTRNTVSLAGEWLANTTMVKPLAAAKASEPRGAPGSLQ